jgi:hypothetical protein
LGVKIAQLTPAKMILSVKRYAGLFSAGRKTRHFNPSKNQLIGISIIMRHNRGNDPLFNCGNSFKESHKFSSK